MILGSYSPSVYFVVSSVSLAVTLFIIYGLSQYYNHEKPFPQASISAVSGHFPEYVFFRTAAISGCLLFVLGWMSNFLYLKNIANEKAIDLKPYGLSIMTTIGISGSVSLMASTSLIDTRYENQHIHQKCA